jgi:hypothetical protein
MAISLQANRLGWQKSSHTSTTNLDTFPVTVRRQDSTTTENVNLMDELTRFLDNNMPEAVSKYMAFPQSFQYDQDALSNIHGFPEEARTRFSNPVPSGPRPTQRGPKDSEQILKKAWRTKGLADFSEAKTFRALETLFQGRPSLLLTGVKSERILRVARESAKYSLTQSRKQDPNSFSVPLTKEERMLAEALGFDLSRLETEITGLVALSPHQTPSISGNDLLAAVNSKSVRPGFTLMEDDQKSQYHKTLTRAVKQMFDKSKRDLSPEEVVSYLTRFLLDLVEKKGEFDHFLADRDSSTFIHVEVKSYPQKGKPDKVGLKENVDKANEQLGKCDKLFQNVLASASKLSSFWKKLNIICFPEISSRQQLRDLGVDENSLKFILTAEELESGNWFEDLGLPDCQAPEEEYKRLLAICVGSSPQNIV